MKDIKKIVKKDLFLNSYEILHDYILNKKGNIQDINLILLEDYIINLSKKQIKKYYKKYIKTGLVYSKQEFFASDLVTVPKGIADVREYRFFSAFAMILYNSFGIFFAEMCSEMVKNLDLRKREIYSYAPTRYKFDDQNKDWKVNNEWKREYRKFKDKIQEKTKESDAVLHIDISNFFNSIDHKHLVWVINNFAMVEHIERYSFDGNSEDVLSYYFLSMMGKNKGLPQGKKNFTSDYLAFLYLLKFDMDIESLVSSKILNFTSMVRYVDDIYIFFNNRKNTSNRFIHKELSRIEHILAKWLYKELDLNINGDKTIKKVIKNKNSKNKFIDRVYKQVSGPNKKSVTKKEVKERTKSFVNGLGSFSYPSTRDFSKGLNQNKYKEDLKNVYNNNVKNFLLKENQVKKIKKVLENIDFELTATSFNILVVLFSLKNKKNKNPYIPFLIDYLKNNFNPVDKRHIHISLIASSTINSNKFIKNLVKQNKKKLLKDDYGKYLVAYHEKNLSRTKFKKLFSCHWLCRSKKIYHRIYNEKCGKFKNYPFLSKSKRGPFDSIILNNNKEMDSIYNALGGYVHEFYFNRWSVAYNKLQMVIHESAKLLFSVKETDSSSQIIKKFKKEGLKLSTHEERDFLMFWHRRNFNPVSHGSKKGLTAPEVTKKELLIWEEKMILLAKKMFSN